MAVHSGNVFVQKRAYFGNRYWKQNRLVLSGQCGTIVWTTMDTDVVKGVCDLEKVYRSIYLKQISAGDQKDRRRSLESQRSEESLSTDFNDRIEVCDYVLVIPMVDEDCEQEKIKRMEFAFASTEELCKWLRLFVTVLGGREWISNLIPDSDVKWKIDSAVGYVSPYDSCWPDSLEKWPWLWQMFRLSFKIEDNGNGTSLKSVMAHTSELVQPTALIEHPAGAKGSNVERTAMKQG